MKTDLGIKGQKSEKMSDCPLDKLSLLDPDGSEWNIMLQSLPCVRSTEAFVQEEIQSELNFRCDSFVASIQIRVEIPGEHTPKGCHVLFLLLG